MQPQTVTYSKKAIAAMTNEQKLAAVAEIERQQAELIRGIEKYREDNKLEYVPKTPNQKQAAILDAFLDPAYKVFTYSGGNRSGKTTTGIWLSLSTMFGEYVWNHQKLHFPHRMARKVRIVGQDWEKHIKTVIEPKLREWWPKNRVLEVKKNNVGVDAYWKDVRTGSTLEIMSNNQDSDLFEGWDGDFLQYDEPSKRDIRVACARGLIDRKGREYFGMTLLKEAWVSREVIKARLPNGDIDTTVFNVEATIFDNLGFGVSQEGIDQFSKTLTDEEKQARLWGKPAYMSGLVWPQFDRKQNVKERFKVPLDWLVDIQIDFHPAKPWNMLFLATDRKGFKYVVEAWKEKGNPKYIVEQVVRKIRENQYRVNTIQIDPLAKGNENIVEETVFGVMQAAFAAYGFCFDTASKEKDSGMTLVRDLLRTENDMPGLFFFKDCSECIQQVEDFMFDPDTLKPSKVNDDFCECLYRAVLVGTQWYATAANQTASPAVML